MVSKKYALFPQYPFLYLNHTRHIDLCSVQASFPVENFQYTQFTIIINQ